MADKRVTRVSGEFHRTFQTEDGVHYRGEHQEMDPVLAHVRYLDEKVNGAPKPGNKNDWRYFGSIPVTVLTDWCSEVGIGLDAYARNQFGEKQKFMDHLKAEMPVFLARKQKNSMIVVP